MKSLKIQIWVIITIVLLGVGIPIVTKLWFGFYRAESFFDLWVTLWGTFIGALLALEMWFIQYNYQEKRKARNKAILACVICRERLIEVFPKLDDDSIDIENTEMRKIIEQSIKTLKDNLYNAIIPIFKIDNLKEDKIFLEILNSCSMVSLFLNLKDKEKLEKYVTEFYKRLGHIQKEFGAEFSL